MVRCVKVGKRRLSGKVSGRAPFGALRLPLCVEMVLQHNVTLGNDTVVMCVKFVQAQYLLHSHAFFRVWISSANAAAITAKGFRLVHSPSDYFYLVRPLAILQ